MCVCEPPTLNTPVVRGIKPVNSPLKYSFLLCCHCCEETLKQLVTHNSKLARACSCIYWVSGVKPSPEINPFLL